jgi:hypothetical protein
LVELQHRWRGGRINSNNRLGEIESKAPGGEPAVLNNGSLTTTLLQFYEAI